MSNELTITKSNGSDLPVKAEPRAVTPRVDIFENDNEFLIAADLPGVVSDAVEARIDAGSLHLEGMQSVQDAPEGFVPLRFLRTFQVPKTVDPEGVKAELKHGVLWVHLAKAAAAKPRRIEVSAG